jgi:hypothetical protein
MLGSLIEWFLGRAGDRRQYKRRKATFHLWWQPTGSAPKDARPGLGLEVSPNGIAFMIQEPITTDEYNLVLAIRNTKIPVRVKNLRSDTIEQNGKTWHRYMGEFTGIAADNWDRIVRYINDEPEPVDRRKTQNQEMDRQPDDAYRLLPLAIQEKIVDILVEKHRLERPNPGQSPLLKIFYSGAVKRGDKPMGHRIHVHSRVNVNGEMIAYDTRFIVSDDGSVEFA